MRIVKLILKILLWAYLAYLGLSLLVVMPAMNVLAPRYMKQYTGRDLHTDIILFNPFALALEVRGASVPEHSGERFLGFRRAAVNLSLASLWRPGLVFDEVALEELFLHVERGTDGELNFADMIPPEPDPPEPESDEPLVIPGITIDDLRLTAERLQVTDRDRLRDEPFSTHWDGLDMAITGFTTVVEEGNPYHLEASSEAGGRLRWDGEVSVPGAYSRGRLVLENIDLRTFWRAAKPWVNFELEDGRLRVSGNYRVSWSDRVRFHLEDGATAITSLALRPRDSAALPDTRIGLAKLAVEGVAVDSGDSAVEVATVAVTGLDLAGWSEGAEVSLAQMLEPRRQAAAAPAGEPEAPAAPVPDPPAQDGATWRLSLGEFTLDDSRVDWRSEFTEPSLTEVTPITLRVGALSWPPGESATPFDLELAVNGAARFAIDGELVLASGNGGVDYRLDGLHLPWFSPALPEFLHAEFTGGDLNVAGRVSLADFSPARITQDGSIDEFSGSVRGEEASLTSWDRVSWTELDVDLAQQSVVLQRLAIRGYSGRLHIYEDGTINTQRLIQQEMAEAEAEGAAAGEEPAAADAETTPWSVSVPLITIDDTSIDFMDQSMLLPFRTVIGGVNGDIAGLGSEPGDQASVDLEGSVDGYAPVKLAGTVSPLADPLALDLALSFDGLDLVRLTPYSGTYAGYAIDRGTLTLAVQYQLEDNRLRGANSLHIDQFRLGDKVDSDKAMDLPLKLAVALLTDVNGNIDLNVPVSGSMDDPGFSIAGVVAGAFVNLITKAAAAPFKLLAGLVGSDEDLQRINFPAGSAELDEVAAQKLLDLAQAMRQRPGIRLVAAGRIHPEADPQFLRQQALDAALLAGGLSQESIDSRDEAWEEEISRRYAALAPQEEALPSIREQHRRLRATMPADPAALKALAEERAVAVKRFLANQGGVEAGRTAIAQSDPGSADNRFSGVELDVDA